MTLTYFRKLAAASESEDDDDRLVFRIFLTPTYKSCQSDSSLYTPCKGRSLLAEALLARPGAMVSADLDSGGYCVPKVLLCDGVVNCMQSEAVGYDESACDRPEVVDEDSNLEGDDGEYWSLWSLVMMISLNIVKYRISISGIHLFVS